MSYAAKWLGDSHTIVKALPDFQGYQRNKKDDRLLVQDLHKLLSQADILVAHNIDRFDMRKANARFIIHGLDPIPPVKTIDTLKIARRHFNFNSNKLDDLGNYLGVGRKLANTGKHLWLSCIAGDMASWKMMKDYNKQDTLLLEKVYLKLRPYASNHPNINLESRSPYACPKCGSLDLEKRGMRYTRTSEYQRFQCRSCFGWSSGKPEKIASQVYVR